MIFVLTGPIGSGKTTRLQEWIKGKKDIGGVLMPVENGIRSVYSINTGESYPVELTGQVPEDKVIRIGKYRFSKEIFEWGNSEILKAFEINGTVVIDEVGPLELNRKGFYSVLNRIFSDAGSLGSKKIIIVVRKGLVEEVTGFFNIKNFRYFGI